jgi:DNA-binding Xre family transcriptional regulator
VETLATKRGRQPTGRTTLLVRIPIALKPAVAELVASYRLAKQRAWEAQPLRKHEPSDDDMGLVSAAEAALDRLAEGKTTVVSFEEWERRCDALDG